MQQIASAPLNGNYCCNSKCFKLFLLSWI